MARDFSTGYMASRSVKLEMFSAQSTAVPPGRRSSPKGSSQRLWDVEYSGPDTVFLAGDNGVISRSTDGGATWKSIQSGGAAVTHDLDALDAKRAWSAQDAGEIAYTTNGGRQWIRASVQGFDSLGKLMAVAFADASRGLGRWSKCNFLAEAMASFARSSDGGKTLGGAAGDSPISPFSMVSKRRAHSTAFAVGGFDLVGGGLVLRTIDADF